MLPPGLEVTVSDAIASKLYGRPNYRVTFEVNKPLHDQAGWHVLWQSPFSVSDGYAVAAEHTLAALKSVGVDLAVRNCWFRSDQGLNRATIDALASADGTGYEVGIMLAVPRYFADLPTPYRIGWTMWETTDPVEVAHRQWPEEISHVNRLWVPTAWQVPVFEKIFDGPVQTVPVAINPRYEYMDRPVRDTFTVVAWGAMSSRKSPVKTVEVFQEAFPPEKYPHCRLRIKTKCSLFGDELNSIPTFEDRRIQVYDGIWHVEDMIGFLYEADCALILSLGEGFGMPAREAMATGLPTILANHSGHEEVCDDRYNWPIWTAQVEASPLGGEWWIPDWDEAVDILRWVYRNRQKALDTAEQGAAWFQQEWGQYAVAKRIIEALQEVEVESQSWLHQR